jgi:hypothetical protein
MADDSGSSTLAIDEIHVAGEEWDRFQHRLDIGHADYVEVVRRNYRYWRGDGGQWADDDRKYMESVQGRKCIEINGIKPAVQTAVGEQVSTRVDMSFAPAKGEASAETAKTLNKLVKQILNMNGYQRREKQVYRDGLIKRRGYFDVRMGFDTNIEGEVNIVNVDPITVIPDPYASGYDPAEWSEFTRFDWLSLDKIEGMYGHEARMKAESHSQAYHDNPYSDLFASQNKIDERFGFGSEGMGYVEFERNTAGERMLRVVERQFFKYSLALCYIDPKSGDVEAVAAHEPLAASKAYAAKNNLLLQKRNVKRVWWRVCTRFAVIYDDWSPYRSFTLIPFFYLFDYGDSMSMVDDAIGPQDLQNKALSSELHILTSTSNSGWEVPHTGAKSSLVGMTSRDLKDKGMKTGLILDYDTTVGKPTKIQPNTLPVGMDRLADRGEAYIKTTTGMSDAEQGLNSPEVSGIAIQSKQFQSKLQQADPHDNMAHTRTLLARKLLELIQDFYTAERIFKVTGKDKATGKETDETFTINQVDDYGNILNDMTVGSYEVAVSSKPVSSTYEETEFRQALAMRAEGILIPDADIIRLSNFDDKYELAERMSNPQDGGVGAAQAAVVKAQEAKIVAETALLEARRKKELAGATNTNIQAAFGATNAARTIATIPGIAPLADELLLSAGYQDANGGELIPQPQAPAPAAIASPVPTTNTSPNFPPQADSGITNGIEGGMP